MIYLIRQNKVKKGELECVAIVVVSVMKKKKEKKKERARVQKDLNWLYYEKTEQTTCPVDYFHSGFRLSYKDL